MFTGYKTTVLFRENYLSDAHIVINQGGTSSGKTYSIMQVLFCLACENAGQIITVVGQDIPNLKAGVLRDALNIYTGSRQITGCVRSYNKTDRVFEFINGSVIEFKSYSDAQDAKSGKRDYLFVNEANGVSWHIYAELALRTAKRISTASIVASVITSYLQLKSDIHDVKIIQETQTRIDDIRLKVLETQISVLQQEVDEMKPQLHIKQSIIQ